MHCQVVELPNKTRAIVCGGRRRSRRDRCACGGSGDYQCDYPSGKTSGTCDAFICSDCVLHLPQANNSLDYCATHTPFVFEYQGLRILVVNNRFVQLGELCDRSTPLGNPFNLDGMNDTSASRLIVIERFRRHLWKQMQKPDNPASLELARLLQLWQEQGELVLRCWCAPRECHSQVIARALIHLLKEKHGDLQGLPRAQGE